MRGPRGILISCLGSIVGRAHEEILERMASLKALQVTSLSREERREAWSRRREEMLKRSVFCVYQV